MIAPATPENEQERLAELYKYNILDTLPETEFDAITRIASEICGTPIALVSIIDADRQWSKSTIGIERGQAERELSFCSYAILNPKEAFIVPDSSKDERVFDNPYVTGEPYVAFYAGIPLVTENGHALGTLCVLDSKPRTLSPQQQETLQALAHQVVCLLELRKSKSELEQKHEELKELNNDLEKFAYVAAHDLKSPAINVIGLARVLRDSAEGKLNNEEMELLDHLEFASQSMQRLVDGILKHTRSAHMLQLDKEEFTFTELMREVRSLVNVSEGIVLEYDKSDEPIISSKAALVQILRNLCENAIKYNDKPKGYVRVSYNSTESHYIFTVADNGIGIPETQKDKVFNLFHMLNTTDRYQNKGTGIGLSTVKKLVEKLEGDINVESTLGAGTRITFTIKK